ncbi:MAG: polymer-forming cytoskeletal protein [Campylobacterales bacterium]
MTAEGKLFVDGEFEGTIRSSGIVTIGESGRVKGELYASLLIVSGSFEGRAECENCEILKEGRVKGEIISDSLVIENGGRFEGFNTLRDTVRAKQETLEA